MRSICFYFQVHQPFRLRTYRFFDIGEKHNYYDEVNNRNILRRVSDKCYLPMNKLLLDLISEYGDKFKISFSISGTALDQFEIYAPDVLDSFKKLADTGSVEFIAETYSHSLSALKSKAEFIKQVDLQKKRIETLFGKAPETFRNTELIYSDGIGEMVAEMGFNTMLTEGAKHVLSWKSPNFMYCNAVNPKLKLLLKNFQLSDDIAFRFSQRSWSEWPLTTEKFIGWLNQIDKKEEMVNLFMDYETFGEHQWPETGIFEFMKALPEKVFRLTGFSFHTPSEVSRMLQPVSAIHVPHPISWADEERDLTAWLGNDLQNEAFDKLYALEPKVNKCNDADIISDWHYLQTSDHFYYMCTKWFSDGDVHKYFNPYGSPYEAFINYMNILSDFIIRLEHCLELKDAEQLPKPKPKNISEPASKIKTKERKPRKKKSGKTRSDKFGFNQLKDISKTKTKEILRKIDPDDLVIAIQGVEKKLREKIVSNLGVRARKALLEKEADIGKPAKAEVQKYRQKIENQVRNLL